MAVLSQSLRAIFENLGNLQAVERILVAGGSSLIDDINTSHSQVKFVEQTADLNLAKLLYSYGVQYDQRNLHALLRALIQNSPVRQILISTIAGHNDFVYGYQRLLSETKRATLLRDWLEWLILTLKLDPFRLCVIINPIKKKGPEFMLLIRRSKISPIVTTYHSPAWFALATNPASDDLDLHMFDLFAFHQFVQLVGNFPVKATNVNNQIVGIFDLWDANLILPHIIVFKSRYPNQMDRFSEMNHIPLSEEDRLGVILLAIRYSATTNDILRAQSFMFTHSIIPNTSMTQLSEADKSRMIGDTALAYGNPNVLENAHNVLDVDVTSAKSMLPWTHVSAVPWLIQHVSQDDLQVMVAALDPQLQAEFRRIYEPLVYT